MNHRTQRVMRLGNGSAVKATCTASCHWQPANGSARSDNDGPLWRSFVRASLSPIKPAMSQARRACEQLRSTIDRAAQDIGRHVNCRVEAWIWPCIILGVPPGLRCRVSYYHASQVCKALCGCGRDMFEPSDIETKRSRREMVPVSIHWPPLPQWRAGDFDSAFVRPGAYRARRNGRPRDPRQVTQHGASPVAAELDLDLYPRARLPLLPLRLRRLGKRGYTIGADPCAPRPWRARARTLRRARTAARRRARRPRCC